MIRWAQAMQLDHYVMRGLVHRGRHVLPALVQRADGLQADDVFAGQLAVKCGRP